MLIRSALISSLLLLSACATQAPMAMLPQQPGQVQAASDPRSTNGALLLIEDMAHATKPQDLDRIEAAFKIEIAKSTRPSLDKILKATAKALNEHPIPGIEPASHPLARLIYAAQERYLQIMSRTLLPRMMDILLISQQQPLQQEPTLQKLERSLSTLPKMDAQMLLQEFNEGSFAEVIAPKSALHRRLVAMFEARLARL